MLQLYARFSEPNSRVTAMAASQTEPRLGAQGGSYLQRVKRLANERHVHWPEDDLYPRHATLAIIKSAFKDVEIIDQLSRLEELGRREDQKMDRVIVIRNITPDGIESIGTKYSLDPAFFVEHARNPGFEKHWTTQWEHVFVDEKSDQPQPQPFYNLSGTYTCHAPQAWLEPHHERPMFFPRVREYRKAKYHSDLGFHGKDAVQIRTRISYIRADEHTCKWRGPYHPDKLTRRRMTTTTTNH